jgi:hypothetical protein
MSTVWSEVEFTSVAKALGWPITRQANIVTGFPFDVQYQDWSLNTIVQTHTDAGKAEILALAQRINTKESERWDSLDCSAGTTKVDGIELDSEKALRALGVILGEMRDRLSKMIPFPLCEGGGGAGSGLGGVQGACVNG